MLALGHGPVPLWPRPLPFEWPLFELLLSAGDIDISRLANMVASSQGFERAVRLLGFLSVKCVRTGARGQV